MALSWDVIFDTVPSILRVEGIDLPLEGITNFKSPQKNHLIFVGGKRYWQTLTKIWEEESFSDLIILVLQSFYEQVKEDELTKKIFTSNRLILTTSLEESMCGLSKLFFEQQESECNDLVDGRQMGTSIVDSTAWIGQNVFLGKNVTVGKYVKIYPGCVIMSFSTIGDGSVLYPNVTLYPRTSIGKNVIIHAGARLGTDGYGFNLIQGKHEKIWHLGHVVLEDNVEIGGNCSIDKGTFGETRIKQGTKFDNLVHIAHNVTVGANSLLCGQVGIAGSSTIEDYCVFGGQAAVTNDVTVGTQSQIGGAAVVTGNVGPKSVLAGHPARPVKEWLRGIAFLRKNSLR